MNFLNLVSLLLDNNYQNKNESIFKILKIWELNKTPTRAVVHYKHIVTLKDSRTSFLLFSQKKEMKAAVEYQSHELTIGDVAMATEGVDVVSHLRDGPGPSNFHRDAATGRRPRADLDVRPPRQV